MKHRYLLSSLLLATFLLFGSSSYAQLSGTITVPTTPNFPTLKAVVDSLNLYGLSGAVTINVTADETAPAGGYILGTPSSKLNSGANSTSAARTITINGNGRMITAQVGTSTISKMDGIFIIAGVDYVTIDSLNLRDLNSGASSTDPVYMEWGYALLKHSRTVPYDGAQHITIRNCVISLNLATVNTTAIYSGNHDPGNDTALSGNSATIPDANRHNHFTNNTIYNTSRGIYMRGLTGGALLDNNNRVTDNQMTLGGTGIAVTGIYSAFDSSVIITGNEILTAPDQAAAITAISILDGKGNVKVNNNIIRVSSRGTGGDHYGIWLTSVRTNVAGSVLEISGNKLTDWNMSAATAGAMHLIYNQRAGFDSARITGNEISDIRFGADPGSSSMGAMNVISNTLDGTSSYSTSFIDASDNTIKNISRIGAGSTLTLLSNSASRTRSGICNIMRNKISGVSSTQTIAGINLIGGENLKVVASHNKLSNITATVSNTNAGINCFYGTSSPQPPSVELSYDTLINISSVGSTINGVTLSFPNPVLIHHNYMNNISTATGRINGIYYSGANPLTVYNNIISSLSVAGATGSVYGIVTEGYTDNSVSIYNNFITGLKVSATYSGTNIFGMNLTVGANKVFNNTIRIDPQTTTGANLGATGILFNNSGVHSLDLRNNIIHVNIIPKGTGYTTVLRGSTGGVSGVPPARLLMSSNGNIYYAPDTPFSYVYGEGSSQTQQNGYRATTANVNTACAAFKQFITPRDSRSFLENNLFAGLIPGVWAPAGLAYAEGTGVATYNPQVLNDFSGAARSVQPDAGALEFSGTSRGASGPVINFNPLPLIDYCTNINPTLSAQIVGPNPINVNSLTAPRLYYKKATDKDTFGVYPGNNTSTFNGWKYVEATGTAPNFNFTLQYNRLTGAVAAGDSIIYFIIAQDNATTPNVAVNLARFATGYCANSVNLTAAAGPLFDAPALYGYKLVTGSFTTVSLNGNVCVGATTNLKINPQPSGVTYRWQHDNNTGTFVDIQGATDSIYTTRPLDTSNNYRAIIDLCGASVTSSPVHVSVTIPEILSSLPDTQCGSASLTLHATGSAGTVLKWYNVPAGGVPLDTGTSFTTPFLNTTTDYYVSALNGNGGETVPSPVGNIRTPYGNWGTTSRSGQFFSVNTPVRINSVKAYLSTDNPRKAYLSVLIEDVINTSNKGFTNNFEVMVDTAMRAYTIPLDTLLPVGRYKMTLITGLGDYSSLYTTVANYPYYSISGALAITGGGDANPNLADYYFLYDWSINAGCESPRVKVTATIDTVSAQIAPPAGTDVCAGDSITLFASSNIGYTYQWQQNKADIANAQTSTYSVKNTGDYRVVVTSGTCTDTSDSVSIVVHPLPVPVITASGANNRVLSTGNYTTYQWYLDGLELFGETNRTHTALEPGVYTVFVTDTNGCSNTSMDFPVAVGINNTTSAAPVIKIHPNPATDMVYITSSVPVTATITSADGKVVLLQDRAKSVNVRSFAAGLYLIRLTDSEGRLIHIEKLMKTGL